MNDLKEVLNTTICHISGSLIGQRLEITADHLLKHIKIDKLVEASPTKEIFLKSMCTLMKTQAVRYYAGELKYIEDHFSETLEAYYHDTKVVGISAC